MSGGKERRPWALAPAGVLAALVFLSSGRTASEPSIDASLAADFAGCADVVVEREAVCVLDTKRSIRVAVQAASHEIRATTDAGSPERVTEQRDGWLLLRLTLPANAHELVIVKDAHGVRSTFRLKVRQERSFARIDAANRARNAGNLDEATAEATAALASDSPHERALAHGVLGRIALRKGDIETAQHHLSKSSAEHAANGHLGARTEDVFALAFLLCQRARRLEEARAVLDALEPQLVHHPEGAARLPLYRINIAIAMGDARGALEHARKARSLAGRLGLRSTERRASLAEANHLATIGELDAARSLLVEHRRLLESAVDATACEKAEHASAECDVERLAHRDTAQERAAERMLALTEHDCPDATMRTAALTTLASAAADAGRHPQARELLGRARTAMKEPRITERILWDDIEGRIALALDRLDDALAAFDRERELAEHALLPAAAWQAEVGRGRVLEKQHRLDEAEEAYRHAEDLLSRFVLEIPLGEGRGVLLSGKSESAGRLVDLLLRRDRTKEALNVMRAARARDLSVLSRAHRLRALTSAGRADWDLTMARYVDLRREVDDDAAADWSRTDAERALHALSRKRTLETAHATLDRALSLLDGPRRVDVPRTSTIDAGDLILATFTTPTRTVAIVADAQKARAFTLEAEETGHPTTLEEWAARLLEPAAAEIATARRVLVLATGSTRDVPVHALPFRGEPLLAHVRVVYPLDLGAPLASTGGGGVLIVSDPSGDLAGAHAEGDELAKLLGARAGVTHLDGVRAAAPAVRSAMAAVDVFHYAGHASFGGRDGIDSALRLADAARVEIGDIFSLPHAPTRVVLDACEAGRADPRAQGIGFGLAQAFVASGSAIVIAPTRPVPDRVGVHLARALYPAFVEADVSAATAIAHAALRDLARSALPDWDAFRIFVP